MRKNKTIYNIFYIVFLCFLALSLFGASLLARTYILYRGRAVLTVAGLPLAAVVVGLGLNTQKTLPAAPVGLKNGAFWVSLSWLSRCRCSALLVGRSQTGGRPRLLLSFLRVCAVAAGDRLQLCGRSSGCPSDGLPAWWVAAHNSAAVQMPRAHNAKQCGGGSCLREWRGKKVFGTDLQRVVFFICSVTLIKSV